MDDNAQLAKPASLKIGSIYACTAGDHRYGTTIEVHLVGAGVEIRLLSTGAVGGMDGTGEKYDNPAEVLVTWAARPTPAELLKRLRSVFKTADFGTVAEYGKPTQRFTWYVNGAAHKGLNAALAARALNAGVQALVGVEA